MSRRRTQIAITALAALAALAIAASALASSANTTVRVNRYDLGFLYGVVKSPQPACKDKRRVTLYGKGTAPSPDAIIGGKKTGKNGKWQISDTGLYSQFYATVNQRIVHVNGKKITCKDATSGLFTRP